MTRSGVVSVFRCTNDRLGVIRLTEGWPRTTTKVIDLSESGLSALPVKVLE